MCGNSGVGFDKVVVLGGNVKFIPGDMSVWRALWLMLVGMR